MRIGKKKLLSKMRATTLVDTQRMGLRGETGYDTRDNQPVIRTSGKYDVSDKLFEDKLSKDLWNTRYST
jgi:hypothetical protein